MATLLPIALFAAVAAATPAGRAETPGVTFKPEIPRTWDDEAVRSWALPLAGLGEPPSYVSEDYYYRMPERVIYRSYPVYALGKEPPGYMEWLARQEPEVVSFDPAKLKTEADWIAAGEVVFTGADKRSPRHVTGTVADIHDPAYYREVAPPVAADGTLSGLRYLITKKGEVQLSLANCSGCHTRVLSDGRTVRGAQGNIPLGRRFAFNMRRLGAETWPRTSVEFTDSSVPWLGADPAEPIKSLSFEELVALYRDSRPPGVVPRTGSSWLYPAKVPDLIGVRDRKYLDATGLVRNRSIGDLMRYAATVATLDRLTHYGKYQIYAPPADPPTQDRFSDAQLYALALYVYSLRPPENPNRPSELSRRGERVFEREGCAGCHTPPLYTNNKLTLASGVTASEADKQRYDVLPVSLGTDTRLSLQSRKGTGYYKVPSLRGVWYRGPFEHNGSVATLEDWFDPKRLRDDYVPTGFKGFGVTTRAVKGHEFGLKLSADDKRALIAFLKTL